jgi:hypothetical protein
MSTPWVKVVQHSRGDSLTELYHLDMGVAKKSRTWILEALSGS